MRDNISFQGIARMGWADGCGSMGLGWICMLLFQAFAIAHPGQPGRFSPSLRTPLKLLGVAGRGRISSLGARPSNPRRGGILSS